MLPKLIELTIAVTAVIYAVGVGTGVFILVSVVIDLGKLANANSGMVAQETSTGHVVGRAVFAISLITMNTIAVLSLVSLGATQEQAVIYDPHNALDYTQITIPNSDELILTLFAKTLSGCLGGLALYAGLNHGQHIFHPQEQVRKSARLRAFWGVAAALPLIFPEFALEVVAVDFPLLGYFRDLLGALRANT